MAGAWHIRPAAYPYHCVQCERAEPGIGPFHRGATITVAVRGGRGEVAYTLWTCKSCMTSALSAELSPFKDWGPAHTVGAVSVVPPDVTTLYTTALSDSEMMTRIRAMFGDTQPSDLDEPAPVKRGPGRPRKTAA